MKNPNSQSGIFNPRISCAFALCSAGALLAMFSLAATPLSELASGAEQARSESSPSRKPAEVAGRITTAPPTLFQPDQMATGFASEANALPPGVPLPPGMASSPRDPRGTPFSINGQGEPAPLNVPQPDASESMLLASGAQSDWAIVPSPNATTVHQNILSAVTCVSASECWVVGHYYLAGSAYQTLIERWDGTSWAIVSSPNTSATRDNLLYGVTCASPSKCWAVGYYSNGAVAQTLIERWDGNSWAIVTSPNNLASQGNVLYSVTCVAASDCWAVGTYSNGSAFIAYQTLIEHWDGTSWAIVASPNRGTTQTNYLFGVTCVSASNCWAVGYYAAGSVAYQTLIERWDGTSWTLVTSANTSTTQSNLLAAVTCVAASDCWTVGTYGAGGVPQTLIERWDGTSWAIVTSPNTNAAQSNYLEGVTCMSASDCWAVGHYYPGGAWRTFVQRWDGTSWTIVTSPNTSATQHNYLYGVTCVSASDCWAVGYYNFAGTFTGQTLIEHWDGSSWAIVSSPNTNATPTNYLKGVTCVSAATDCWAVGYYDDGTAYQTLIERWDGASWALVTSPNTSTTRDNILYSVTCASASNCWAVGYYNNNGSVNQTLIERWDGTSWAIVTSPNRLTGHNQLSGVTCLSASNCWAVGYYNINGSAYQTLIEHWDGTSWAIITSPNTSATQSNYLYGVTCAAASECWAVGFSTAANTGVISTLTQRWDGTSWAIVSSPNTSTTQSDYLYGVTCVSASECWAVGADYLPGNVVAQTLIERWDGTSWAIVTSPNTLAAQADVLYGVTCVSASECWAVGYYAAGSSANQTLIERWDGTSWAIVTSPNTSTTQSNYLYGVTCVSASECWAVGYYNIGSAAQTLTEHFAPPAVQLVSVASRKTHGSAGTFDIDLPLTGTRGVECRSGGATGDYTMVFTFLNPVTNCGSASTGSLSSGPNPNQCTVNLTGVPNAQYTTVTLTGAVDSTGATGNVSGTMGILVGDVNATGLVDGNDVSAVQGQARQSANSTNFRLDVNTTGLIDGNDVSLVQSKTRTSLPTPP